MHPERIARVPERFSRASEQSEIGPERFSRGTEQSEIGSERFSPASERVNKTAESFFTACGRRAICFERLARDTERVNIRVGLLPAGCEDRLTGVTHIHRLMKG